MKPRINYRAERAERAKKKAQKKEARLASLSRKPDEVSATENLPEETATTASVHRYSD